VFAGHFEKALTFRPVFFNSNRNIKMPCFRFLSAGGYIIFYKLLFAPKSRILSKNIVFNFF